MLASFLSQVDLTCCTSCTVSEIAGMSPVTWVLRPLPPASPTPVGRLPLLITRRAIKDAYTRDANGLSCPQGRLRTISPDILLLPSTGLFIRLAKQTDISGPRKGLPSNGVTGRKLSSSEKWLWPQQTCIEMHLASRVSIVNGRNRPVNTSSARQLTILTKT